MGKTTKTRFKLLPLYIGVTGHRDIRDEDRGILKQGIKDFIEKKQKQCPNTPIVLLTPLAEGADRIAAEAALDCNVDFIAVLPMPVDEYRKDFVNVESTKEFERLLALRSFKIELSLQKGTSIDQVNKDIKYRNEQYYQNGLFIARQCHILLALWDGTDNGKKGGTADVVKLKKSGIPGKFEDNSKRLRHLQTGPIYQIITPRISHAIPENPFSVINYPAQLGANKLKAVDNDRVILDHIDSFNKDMIKFGPRLKEKIDNSTNYLLKNYPDLSQSQILINIAEKHAVAGELATFFQKRRFLALKVLLFLIVLAFIFLHSNAEFFHEPKILLLYPITMGIGAIWFIIARKKRYEYKHEDYRALSEAFRIQFFMKACGRQDNVSDHYLKRHRGQLEWVLYALRTTQINDFKINDLFPGRGKNILMKKYKYLKTSWIDHQLVYFTKKTKEHSDSSKKWEILANLSFIFGILSACLLFIVSFFKDIFPENFKIFETNLHSTLACCTSIFLVLAAALHGYSDKMIFAEQAKNYLQMAQLFQLASEKLDHAIKTNDLTEANDIIGELAQEALLENGDWLLLHRSRPLEIPKG